MTELHKKRQLYIFNSYLTVLEVKCALRKYFIFVHTREAILNDLEPIKGCGEIQFKIIINNCTELIIS